MTDKTIYMMKAVPEDVANEVIERTGGMRLNSAMKDQVIKKAIAHAFDKREAVLLKEEHAIAKALFVHAFGARAISLVKQLGEPFVYANMDGYGNEKNTGTTTTWYVGGQHVNVRLLDIPVPQRFGERLRRDHGKKNPFSVSMEKNATLVERCRAWQDACVTLMKEMEKVKTTLGTMLQSISTYKSLEKNWPEGKPFYKHLPKEFPFRHQVPANLVSELNKALGV